MVELFRGEYSGEGNREHLIVQHGKVGAVEFALGIILKHINMLRDALGIDIVAHHLCGEINELAWVEPAAVCV